MDTGEILTINKLKELDIEFWNNMCDSSLQEQGYNFESMCFYGEISFLLLGMKHCVMFSGLTKPNDDSMMRSYIDSVLNQSGLFATFPQLRLQQLHPLLKFTTDNYDATGEYVMWREDDTNQTLLKQMKSTFLLEPQKPTVFHASETMMAEIFDYPCALPENEEMQSIIEDGGDAKYDLCEVAYLDVANNNEKRVIATYGARRIIAEIERAKQHYLR
jgi:hypothetical protein